jgi:hypothetical protein
MTKKTFRTRILEQKISDAHQKYLGEVLRDEAELVSGPDQNKPKHHRKKNQNKHILYLKSIEPPKMGVCMGRTPPESPCRSGCVRPS